MTESTAKLIGNKASNIGAFFNDPTFKAGMATAGKAGLHLAYYAYYLLVLAVCVLYWTTFGAYRLLEFIMEKMDQGRVAWEAYLKHNKVIIRRL